MKILFVSSNWKVFGAEVVTLRLLEGLQARGHELQVVTSQMSDGDFSRRLMALKIPETQLPLGMLSIRMTWYAIRGTWWSLQRLPVLWWKFSKLVRTFQPEVVVITSKRQCQLLFPLLGLKPAISTAHDNECLSLANRVTYQLLSLRLRAFVPVSDFTATHLKKMGLTAAKIKVIKNAGHSLADIVKLVPGKKFAQHPVAIGLVGQIAPHKGHEVMIEALELLRAKQIPVQVKVYGGGSPEYLAELTRRLQAKGLTDDWQWCGYERDTHKIFGGLDICVQPSQFDEPFGMVAVEAAAYGLPVVASRRGGLPEIVQDGQTGFLVESGSAEALAEKIAWLAEHPAEGRAMGIAARERVMSQFTIERMVAEYEALFEKVVALQQP